MTKRSLFMAGGGIKVAYQAGVLQVWLDEAGLTFDHADGVSAGVFNLAMWCQGFTGRQIADSWRRFRPLAGLSVNVRQLAWLPTAASILTYRRFRQNVLPRWGLDWDVIRATDRKASFNLYDVTAAELVTLDASEMDEATLMAAVSLPMWFPPVDLDGHTCVDAVHATGANLEHAIDAGADELWVIWTVSTAGRWRGGFVNEYFQIFEECTNSRLRGTLARIERSNALIADGLPGEFGRPLTVRLYEAEVPLHYLLNFRRRKIRAAVNLGVTEARVWCRREGLLPT